MPVTARLSRLFYERFGDEIVDELVEWLNAVDATYRTELRAINDVNYARFDARLEQRIAELRGELLAQIGGLRGEFKGELQELKADLVKWMFVFWAGSALAGYLLR